MNSRSHSEGLPPLYDTHAHLCSPSFAADLEEVLARAHEAGVRSIVAVGETRADAMRNLELQRRHPMVHAALGLYPTVLDEGEADALESLIRENLDDVVAVGEIGLDHWKVKEPADLELQEQLFRRFVRLAIELDLPVNVHSRSAGRRTLEVLLDEGATRVQMHAFDGRAAKAMSGLEAGYFFSVPASVVRSKQKQKLVARLPLDQILLETDSPVLGPEPSQRNEPSAVRLALAAVAEIHGVSEQVVAEAAAQNTHRLYGARLDA